MLLRKFAFAALLASAVGVADRASAGVSLLITDNDATPNNATVAAGGTVTIQVRLLSTTSATTDASTGEAYYLKQSTGQTGVFSITSYDVTSSVHNDPISTQIKPYNSPTDNAVVDPTGGNNVLNPTNAVDMGAGGSSISNNYTTFNPGLLAIVKLAVAPNTPVGQYTITTGPNGSAHYGYTDPNFGDDNFVAAPTTLSNGTTPMPYTDTFTINVTAAPEPASLALFGAVATFGLIRRRRTAAV
jgi:hypothetical protein